MEIKSEKRKAKSERRNSEIAKHLTQAASGARSLLTDGRAYHHIASLHLSGGVMCKRMQRFETTSECGVVNM